MSANENGRKARAETGSRRAGVSRRQAVRALGMAGLGVAALGAVSTSDAQVGGGGATGQFLLPLDLETTKGFELFLQCLDDDALRRTISQSANELPEYARDLLSMLDDSYFTSMAVDVAMQLQAYVNRTTSLDEVKKAGVALEEYLSTTYPDGLRALKDYALRVYPAYEAQAARLSELLESGVNDAQRKPCEVGAWLCAAALVGGVVNALAWANVAFATMAVVALAAVVVAVVV